MKIRLGVDIACRAAHQASLADEHGAMLFAGHRFSTDPDDLDTLWARLPAEATEVMVVMEPTRNAWVPLASWFRRHGAVVVMVPPGAVRGSEGLLQQAHQDRPVGLQGAGPVAVAAP